MHYLRLLASGLLCLCAAAIARPLDFTPEERAQFTEATHAMPRVELPAVTPDGAVAAWLDESHVLYSTREIQGVWKAARDELAKVVVFDVAARTVQESPYRGNLLCYAGGRLLVAIPRSPESTAFTPRNGDRLLGGRFGESLEPVPEVLGREVLAYSCALNPIQKSDEPVTEVPLLPGDGSLRLPRRGAPAPVHPGYGLYDPGGELRVPLAAGDLLIQSRIYYLPWRKAYFWDNGTAGRSDFLWPQGQRRGVAPPALLASFAEAGNVGSARAIPTRAGILWNLMPWNVFWRMQGMYLQGDDGRLTRVDDAYTPSLPRAAVSADGCSVFYFRRPGDPQRRRATVPTIMNMCEGR